MRIIKLSQDDSEMPTREDVIYYFTVTLRRRRGWGRFGLSPRKRNLPDVRRGTLLVFSYQTEFMFVARAAGEVVHDGDPVLDDYLPIDMATVRPVSGSLHEYEELVHTKGLSSDALVSSREWPKLSDDCETATLRYLEQPPSPGPLAEAVFNEKKARLDQTMLDLFPKAGRETRYWGRYYLRSVRKHGGLATAQRMLQPKRDDKIDKGLQALMDAGRADELSVEAIALRDEFQSLFSPVELAEARRRLNRIPVSARQQPVPPERNHPDEVDPNASYEEGRVKTVLVNVYERDSEARDDCLRHHGYNCAVCEMNFEAVYGELGLEFIHVHHKKPLALRKGPYKINPRLDLVPVCPNCHAMLHATKPPQTIEQLQRIYTAGKNRASVAV